jgi:hypothetical protein
MTTIPKLGKQSQEDPEFQASQYYAVKTYLRKKKSCRYIWLIKKFYKRTLFACLHGFLFTKLFSVNNYIILVR